MTKAQKIKEVKVLAEKLQNLTGKKVTLKESKKLTLQLEVGQEFVCKQDAWDPYQLPDDYTDGNQNLTWAEFFPEYVQPCLNMKKGSTWVVEEKTAASVHMKQKGSKSVFSEYFYDDEEFLKFFEKK